MSSSPRVRQICGIGIIAATYVYFLIFAEFAFLRLIQLTGVSGAAIRPTMGAMAVAGILTSLWTARIFSVGRAERLLFGGLLACSASAALALTVRNSVSFAVVGALIGCSLGLLTVSLAGNLPRLLPGRTQGFSIGLGTGLAYAVCNIPGIFAAAPAVQAGVAIASCLGGTILALVASGSASNRAAEPELPLPQAAAGRSISFPALLAIFLILIWLDSGAFYILQNTPALNRFGWAGPTLQWTNLGVHFAAALLAGLWLDRGRLSTVLLVAFGALAAAAICVTAHTPAAHLTHWLYAAGVSLYSAALVFTPLATSGGNPARCAARAGTLYAVAGWAGSALGIGMAQDMHTVPRWFVGVSTIIFICAFGWRGGIKGGVAQRRAGIALAAGGLLLVVAATSSSRYRSPSFPAADPELLIKQGREVYISEGCMNCHSQFVRPGSLDEVMWGPAADAGRVLHEVPPLIGNRRQGPDLMNVGNRRSAAWNRLHLIDPRAVTPGSRMPSYASLFKEGNFRGEALLAYLGDLGADSWIQRALTRTTWRPSPTVEPIPRAAQRTLFGKSCSQCHGLDGKGEGPLFSQLGARKPRDLTRGEWQFISREQTLSSERRIDMARLIKFGIPGTSMPGHEYYSDVEIVGLAEYVETLHATQLGNENPDRRR